jgi:hypothetical protein
MVPPTDIPFRVSVSAEEAGSHCPLRGQRVATGLDEDLDDFLDSVEVSQISYVCNGSDGANGLNGTDGADGANGADGARGDDGAPGSDGIGSDADRDGVSSAAEVESTVVVCNGADASSSSLLRSDAVSLTRRSVAVGLAGALGSGSPRPVARRIVGRCPAVHSTVLGRRVMQHRN